MNNLKISKTFLLSLAFLLVCLLAGALFCGCSDGSVTEKPPPTATSTPSPTPTATVTEESVGTPEIGDNAVTFPEAWGDWTPATTQGKATSTPITETVTSSATKEPTPTPTPTIASTSSPTEPASSSSSTIAVTPTATLDATPSVPATIPPTPTDPDGEGWLPGWY